METSLGSASVLKQVLCQASAVGEMTGGVTALHQVFVSIFDLDPASDDAGRLAEGGVRAVIKRQNLDGARQNFT